MTTLQGEWVANSKSISWMLHLMQSTPPVDADTRRAIEGGLVKNSAEGAEVEKHRQFVAAAFPDRKQRASKVSRHLHEEIPALQAALERIGFVMQQANEQQTEILGSMMLGHTDTILEAVAGLTAKMVVLTEKVEQSQFSRAGHALIAPSTMQISHSADSHGFSGLVDEENAESSSGFTDTDGDVLPGKYTDFCMTGHFRVRDFNLIVLDLSVRINYKKYAFTSPWVSRFNKQKRQNRVFLPIKFVLRFKKLFLKCSLLRRQTRNVV